VFARRIHAAPLVQVVEPGAEHEQQDAACSRPERALSSEEAVVHRPGDEADARISEQHRNVLLAEGR
jgi:hypothetical protein